MVETWGAAVGVFQSQHAHDSEVRRVMQRIASGRSATELSWEIAGLPCEAQRKALWAELAPRLWGSAWVSAQAYQA